MSTRADTHDADPIIELSHYLEDVSLPQGRPGLLIHARACGLSDGALELLHQFPDWQYTTRQQLMRALAEVRLPD